MKYQLNLIEQIRLKEKKELARRNSVSVLFLASFTLLLLSVALTGHNIIKMNASIERERTELRRIEAEYSKYKSTRMIVSKEDIEQLDRLQTGRIFWTRILAAMAYHLPDQPSNPYWITTFSFKKNVLNVKGYGTVPSDQKQLIAIDDYLNKLRSDSTFSDFFTSCYLNEATRKQPTKDSRVGFNFSAEKTTGMPR